MFRNNSWKLDLLNRLANEQLQQRGVSVIQKATRAGCTMSLLKACVESGMKVVVLSPTIRILRQIEEVIPKISDAKPRIAPILSNPELCTKLEPNSQLKFQFKENCSVCEYNGKPDQCVFQDLLLNDFDVYCLTYAKLQALQRSRSEDAKRLLEKLQRCDVFIMDESTTAIVNQTPTIEVVAKDENGVVSRISERIKTEFRDEFERTNKIIRESLYDENLSLLMESSFWGIVIDEFLRQFERSHATEYTATTWLRFCIQHY